MIYLFALWISNENKDYKISMYREVIANSDYEAYKEIVEDAYKYYMEDGDVLNEIDIISREEEQYDTDRIERE